MGSLYDQSMLVIDQGRKRHLGRIVGRIVPILLLLLLLPFSHHSYAVDDAAATLTTSAVSSDCEIALQSGSWSVNTTALGTPTAGSDWSASTIDSSSGTPEIRIRCKRTIGRPTYPLRWNLKVRRTDGAGWREGTTYYLKKSAATDDNGCSLNGGTSWTEVTTSDTTLFSGCGGYTGWIELESRIGGLSVADDDAGVFTDTLTYTVSPTTSSSEMQACLDEDDNNNCLPGVIEVQAVSID